MEKGMEAELIKLREETIDQLMAKNLAAAYALKDLEREGGERKKRTRVRFYRERNKDDF